MKKICPLCGNEFDTVTGRRIVCLTCEEAIYKKQQYFLQTRQRAAYCVVCGKPLHGNQKIACSKECSQIVATQDQEKEMTDFIPCVAWGKLAERIAQDNTIVKGTRVYVSGRISVRSYEKDGKKEYRTQVVVEFFAKGLAGSGQATPPKQAASGQSFNDMGTPTQEEIPF